MTVARFFIRTRYIDRPGLVYHDRRTNLEWLDADGNRYLEYPGPNIVVRWEIRTRCGMLVDWWTKDYKANLGWVAVADPFADMIARPCRKCFDVLDDSP